MQFDDRELLKHVIACLVRHDENHRVAITDMIAREFVQYSLTFFQQIVTAKLQGRHIRTDDWYRDLIINPNKRKPKRKPADIAVLGGTSLKSVGNLRGSQSYEVVVDESVKSYDRLVKIIDELTGDDSCPDLTLSIRMGPVAVDLALEESLIVINSLAMKRGQLRGGSWSAMGKAVEAPLMETLCQLFQVSPQNYRRARRKDGHHEVDFVLIQKNSVYRCEVKLNGRGNPESATAAIGRDPLVVVADYISDQNRSTLDDKLVKWVDLSESNGYRRFGAVLNSLAIKNVTPSDLDQLDDILDAVLPNPQLL